MKIRKIHPDDLFFLLEKCYREGVLVQTKLHRPWWSYFILGYTGPYYAEIILDGVSVEQDVAAPRLAC
jgi:hypothetical protein